MPFPLAVGTTRVFLAPDRCLFSLSVEVDFHSREDVSRRLISAGRPERNERGEARRAEGTAATNEENVMLGDAVVLLPLCENSCKMLFEQSCGEKEQVLEQKATDR